MNGRSGGNQVQEPSPVQKNNRKDRAELNGDFEARSFFTDKTEQMTNENQMTGRRYRYKFREPLYDT
jgi:hypothetical protein